MVRKCSNKKCRFCQRPKTLNVIFHSLKKIIILSQMMLALSILIGTFQKMSDHPLFSLCNTWRFTVGTSSRNVSPVAFNESTRFITRDFFFLLFFFFSFLFLLHYLETHEACFKNKRAEQIVPNEGLSKLVQVHPFMWLHESVVK